MQDQKPINKRLESLDILRGVAMMFIILFHASIYNFANIHKLDFSDPPLVVVLMSFMGLWGGIFIIYSAVVNTVVVLARLKMGQINVARYLVFTAAALLFFHYVLNIVLGRWNIDFVNNRPEMTFIASSLRSMAPVFPYAEKFFEGSSLSTIALNLLVLALIFAWRRRNEKQKKEYLFFGILGSLIIAVSLLRVFIFPAFAYAVQAGNYPVALFASFTVFNPYPLLPYAAYAIFGIMVGAMIHYNRKDLLLKVMIPFGLIFLAFGLVGMAQFPKTISKPDFFWYFKTQMELGLFLLMFAGAYLLIEPRAGRLRKLSFIRWFSRVTLTVYLLETLVSEIIRKMAFAVVPFWDQTVNGCLVFGAVNVAVWIAILACWRRSGFKYSIEYFWVKYFKVIGKQSTKMDNLP